MSDPMRSAPLFAPTVLLMLLAGCSSASTPGASGSGDLDSGETRDASAAEAAAPDAGVQAEAGPASEGGGVGDEAGGAGDAGDAGNGCSYSGAPGECIAVTACAALSDHTSFAGLCPGPASIECCIVTPSTADNPPIPTGYMLMAQSQVTSAMTAWAVQILDDPAMYPMFATAMQTFGTLMVLARVEWHPPDFNNSAVHRGVTLYEPI